ncbi:MAG: peptidoglycan editing factor PgeF [Thermodesulfobacteriota bacterium]
MSSLYRSMCLITSPGVTGSAVSRAGGVSPAPYGPLNLSFGVGDAEANVRENRQRLKVELGISVLASARQVHGDAVWVIDHPLAQDTEERGYDALVTDQPGLGLLIQQADCQAVLLHDPVRRVVAAIHAGWRGSVAGIIGKTIRTMTERFNTVPADLAAAISPSLGPCCAEFVNYLTELPESFHGYQVAPNHFDFWAISRDQLHQAGVREERIETARICTRCCPDYFSFRRERVTGRFGSVIMLSPLAA